jgi:hypothetical protein
VVRGQNMMNLVISQFMGCCGCGSDASRFADLPNVPRLKRSVMRHIFILNPFCVSLWGSLSQRPALYSKESTDDSYIRYMPEQDTSF